VCYTSAYKRQWKASENTAKRFRIHRKPYCLALESVEMTPVKFAKVWPKTVRCWQSRHFYPTKLIQACPINFGVLLPVFEVALLYDILRELMVHLHTYCAEMGSAALVTQRISHTELPTQTIPSNPSVFVNAP